MSSERRSRPLELWAGLECAHIRVGTRSFDQLGRSGHQLRPDDLDLAAGLGVPTLRYPVLWEHVEHAGLGVRDWRRSDERLARLRELGVRPHVGLLHHGNGPEGTELLDPSFPERFAEFAGAVAERYPWIDLWTPVNEPLTTARFCGLYGFWYPHGRDVATFARIFVQQIRATALAMRRIHEVNPEAQLIQNEDLATIYAASPALEPQAAFENARKWLTFDALCGRVLPGHSLWETLREGAGEQELEALAADPCPPDVVGIDHYVTSDRLLDDDLEGYPAFYHGGEGPVLHANVEAVRSRDELPGGVAPLLVAAWERYGLPVAVTEAHISGSREQQMRWLLEIWRGAEVARDAGADVRFVTTWMLFGAYEWNSLMTRESGFYEPGAFDVRGGKPRPTALARLVRHLATGEPFEHPVLEGDGWWRRPERLVYPTTRRASTAPELRELGPTGSSAPLLIVDVGDPLAELFEAACVARGIRAVVSAVGSIRASALAASRPWAVVWAGAPDPQAAALAAWCADVGAGLLALSSQEVFSGRSAPYSESDVPDARTDRARTIAVAEGAMLQANPAALIVRSGERFGNELDVDARPERSATYAPDLVNTCLDLLIDGERGVWHLSSSLELLESERANLLPSLQDALDRRAEAIGALLRDGFIPSVTA